MMSLINGDKSRAHRERKQNIHRRERTKDLLATQSAKLHAPENGKKVKAMGSKDLA
jgi:hypothetical protein